MKPRTKKIVENYGLHLDSEMGVWWLLEQNKSSNAIGLLSKDCPFRIKTPLLLCPHRFDIEQDVGDLRYDLNEYEKRLPHSPLLRFFDPTPAPANYMYVDTENPQHYHTLSLLLNLLSPAYTSATPVVLVKDNFDKVVKKMMGSNLSGMVVYGIDMNQGRFVTNLSTLSTTFKGRTMLAGENIPNYTMYENSLRVPFEKNTHTFVQSLGADKMKKIGLLRLKKFMRGETCQ